MRSDRMKGDRMNRAGMSRARSIIYIAVAFTILAVLVGGAASEAGEVSVSVGVGFVVGDASFHIAYPGRGHRGRGYAPYYYRVESPLYHPGYDCDTHCYARAGYTFHAPYCPVVHRHFSLHHYRGPYHGHSRHYGSRHYDARYHGSRHYGYRDRGYRNRHHGRYYDHGRRGHGGHARYEPRHRGSSHRGYGNRGHGGSHRGRSQSRGRAHRTRP